VGAAHPSRAPATGSGVDGVAGIEAERSTGLSIAESASASSTATGTAARVSLRRRGTTAPPAGAVRELVEQRVPPANQFLIPRKKLTARS